MSHPLLEYLPETEAPESGTLEAAPAERRAALDEGMEVELASELLEATSRADRGAFLGQLVTRAANAAGRPLAGPVQARLRQWLAMRAERLLPLASTPARHAGAPLSRTRLAADAGHVLGLELEGLSPEDQEFEVARSFVRYASGAVRSAARASAGPAPATGRWIRRGQNLVLLDC